MTHSDAGAWPHGMLSPASSTPAARKAPGTAQIAYELKMTEQMLRVAHHQVADERKTTHAARRSEQHMAHLAKQAREESHMLAEQQRGQLLAQRRALEEQRHQGEVQLAQQMAAQRKQLEKELEQVELEKERRLELEHAAFLEREALQRRIRELEARPRPSRVRRWL